MKHTWEVVTDDNITSHDAVSDDFKDAGIANPVFKITDEKVVDKDGRTGEEFVEVTVDASTEAIEAIKRAKMGESSVISMLLNSKPAGGDF
jgi:hypothetical protein